MEILVASLSSCLNFLPLRNPRQNERNGVAVVQRWQKKRAFVQPGLKRMAIIVLTLRLGVFA